MWNNIAHAPFSHFQFGFRHVRQAFEASDVVMLVRNPQRCSNKKWKEPPSAAATELSLRGSLELTTWEHDDQTRAKPHHDRRKALPEWGWFMLVSKVRRIAQNWWTWSDPNDGKPSPSSWEIGRPGCWKAQGPSFSQNLHIKNPQIKADFCPIPDFFHQELDASDAQHAVRSRDNSHGKMMKTTCIWVSTFRVPEVSEFPAPFPYQSACLCKEYYKTQQGITEVESFIPKKKSSKSIKTGWWFGCHFFIFPYIGNLIIPIDVHIFQRGGLTTNQKISWLLNHSSPPKKYVDMSWLVSWSPSCFPHSHDWIQGWLRTWPCWVLLRFWPRFRWDVACLARGLDRWARDCWALRFRRKKKRCAGRRFS